jgi:sugar lactone lactonase YvrE
MSFFTYFLRDIEQLLFPNREQHAIPSMDGALSPNDRLDACTPIGKPIPHADDVVEGADGALYVSGGRQVLRLAGGDYASRSVFATFDGNAGGLAFHPDGRLLVCVAGQGLAAVDRDGRQTWLNQVTDQPLHCLTSVVAAADGSIFISNGSSRNLADDWCLDLMQKNRLGRLIACGPGLDRPEVLLGGLHYPHGLAVAPDGQSLWFTESWNHRLSRAPLQGRGIGAATVVNPNLPGYPARLARATGGGFWLSFLAVRTHLVEFVLREDDFREEMMQTIDPSQWVAPALATSGHCLEPMQFGSIKALGIQKPWAPPRSDGLLVRIDEEGDAVRSLHSRVGGHYHGITAACETALGLVIVSKGGGQVLLDRSGGRA